MINVPIIGVLILNIAILDIRIGNIGSHIFPTLKLSIVFKNFSSFGKYAQFHFDCFDKTFTSNCDALGPLILPEIVTIGQWFTYAIFVGSSECIVGFKPC